MTFGDEYIISRPDRPRGLYKQCLLGSESRRTYSWIPIGLAKVNKKVILDEETKVWTIMYVHNSQVLTREEVIAAGEYYKTHREATDI
jgi:hypothetical protein